MKKEIIIFLISLLIFETIYLIKEIKNENILKTGRKYTISFERGKLIIPNSKSDFVLLIFFSEKNCSGCLNEIKWWKKLYNFFDPNEMEIIGIIPEEEIKNVSTIRKRFGIKFKIGYNDNLWKCFNIKYSPFKILFSKEGNIFYCGPTIENEISMEGFFNLIAAFYPRYKFIENIKQERK